MMNNSFDQAFFDGNSVQEPNPAGYSEYGLHTYLELGPAGIMQRALEVTPAPVGKVLVAGCAYGFLVEELLNAGYDAYGMDISEYAISKASPTIADRLTVCDVLDTVAVEQLGRFALVITEDMFCCLTDEEAETASANIKRIALNTVHLITNAEPMKPYYNVKPLFAWQALIRGPGIVWRHKFID